MKQTKEDKRFQISFDQANRDFLTNLSLFHLNTSISLTALLVSVLAVLYSVLGSVKLFWALLTFVCVFLLWFIFSESKKASNAIRSAKKLNEQITKKMKEEYPEYANKIL
ncbi:MAG: hypothetical protein ACOCP4_04585 [Candidatus Woesearchaeota archaeon]